MSNAIFQVPVPRNEPVLSYGPGTLEREELQRALRELTERPLEIPLIIGGRRVHTGTTGRMVVPHRHEHLPGQYHKAGKAEVLQAINAARVAWKG